jgi:hypothetical protein
MPSTPLAPSPTLAPSGSLPPVGVETVGTAAFPSTTLYPGSSTYPGQGLLPIVRCRIAFDDVSVSRPTWHEVTHSDLRSFSVSRGRSSELSAFDAGTASATIDNRDRVYDPTNTASPYYPNVTPMNRVWLYEEFAGEVQDLFVGYVESYDQEWPGGGWSDAIVTITASDEFKVLALAALPGTNPPRSNYGELVTSDNPDGYWSMNDDPATLIQAAVIPPPDDPVPIWTGFDPTTMRVREKLPRRRW